MKSELFLPEADEEFREAARYYESETPGLGLTFIAEVRRAIRSIVENPRAAVETDGGLRRKVLNRFPYSVLYAVESGGIVIVAVAHHKRRPRYWRVRLRRPGEQRAPGKDLSQGNN